MKWIRLAKIAIVALIGTFASIFLPAIVRSAEVAILQYLPLGGWTQVKYLLCLLWVFVFWALRQTLSMTQLVPAGRIRKIDELSGSILERAIPAGFAAAIVLAFLTWYPHYLYWPWWMDLEHFAVSARMWDLGVRPYRDLVDFNFPGPIYFMWFLGKTVGWDRPMTANAVDGLVVLGTCSMLTIWSRQRLGSSIAGLFASLLAIRYYFSLEYGRVMQRDWYVAVLGISAICVIQASGSKRRWIVAGALMSLAGIIRPYAILFLPPIALACWLEDDARGRSSLRNIVTAAIAMTVGTFVLWLPLVIHGMFDDFLATFLEAAAAENYKTRETESVFSLLLRQSNTKIVFTAMAGLVITSILDRQLPDRFRLTIVWLCALISTLFYMPLCPVRHAYTEIPVEMVACVGCGITLKSLIDKANWAGSVKLVAVLVWFSFHFPGLPEYCDARASRQALYALANGEMLSEPPPGCRTILGFRKFMGDLRYCWEDYFDTIEYVRNHTTPETYVVNYLWQHPFPTINGPTGRPILWPCAEGILWLLWVDPKLERRFAESLSTDRPVLAITHDETLVSLKGCPLPIIQREIETSFEEIARFGKIRISKRKSTNDRSNPNEISK